MSESLTSSSNEVKIKLKHRDWEVEITCIESKVKQVVEDVLSGIDISTTVTQGLNTQIAEFQPKGHISNAQSKFDRYAAHRYAKGRNNL
jgi:hypothetical protein